MAPSAYQSHIFQPGQPQDSWRTLDASSPLSILHAKFWGVDIHEDEAKWLLTQPEGPLDDEGDVGPGCFPLDIEVNSELWVRKDYIRIYDGCKQYCDRPRNKASVPPSVVITGQPGIGKSCWITYAVRRRLGEKNPFLWLYEHVWYLFSERGVYQVPQVPTFGLVLVPYIWAFVDADYSPSGIPPTAASRSLFTIFTTPPQRNRWKPLAKTTDCLVFFMNPWTWEEISQAAAIHRLSDDQLVQAQERYDEYGPTARICFNYVKQPLLLLEYELHLTSRISALSMEKLIEAVAEGYGLQSDVSHAMFLIRRPHVTNLHEFVLEPITRSVGRRLRIQLMEQERKSQLLAYRLLERVVQSRLVAGSVFESMGQCQFQRRIALNLIPMEKQQPADRKKAVQWTSVSSHPTPIPINFTPDRTDEYEGSILNEFQPGVYYVPQSSNQVAFDSFMMVGQILYIFQFTIASSQPIKAGTAEFFSQGKPDTMLQGTDWYFIFIIPPGETILFPQSSGAKFGGFWERVRLFSAVFDPENTNEEPTPKLPPSAPKRSSTSSPQAAPSPPIKGQAGTSNRGAGA